jgi:hypothetical protein
MRCASPMSASSELAGQVRPTALSFARYASSWGLAVAVAALLTKAAPAIMGMASLTNQRGAGIRFHVFLLGVSTVASSMPVRSGVNMKIRKSSQKAPPREALGQRLRDDTPFTGPLRFLGGSPLLARR